MSTSNGPKRGSYPPFRKLRISLADALPLGGGVVAGRLSVNPSGDCFLVDASHKIQLTEITWTSIHPDSTIIDPESNTHDAIELKWDSLHGAWVSGLLTCKPTQHTSRQSNNHTRKASQGTLTHAVQHTLPHSKLDPTSKTQTEILEHASYLKQTAGLWFNNAGFLELQTPSRVICPGLEPHLRPFSTTDRWLITSPELHLKQALAKGHERIFEFARAFRDEESSPWHLPEFTMLEWYRTWEGLHQLEADCEHLIQSLSESIKVNALHGAKIKLPFERTTVQEQLQKRAGINLAEAIQDATKLTDALRHHQLPFDPKDDWDTLFFRLWVTLVEPQLGKKRPVFVHGYPASQAALARIDDTGEYPVAARFELYAGGIELANAFDELNDPLEQRRRHEADRAARIAAGQPAPPLDESFLQALEAGMPPSVGIALGWERLVAGLLGLDNIHDLFLFPME